MIRKESPTDDVCIWCGNVVYDGREVSGYTGTGTDWMYYGDFGCGGSPINDPEEGTGGHVTLYDVQGIYIAHQMTED